MNRAPESPRPEFSRRIPVAELEEGGELRLALAADATERAALARRFGCAGIVSLRADVRLTRHGRRIDAHIALAGRVQQMCVVSLDRFEAAVEERFQVPFHPDPRPQPQSQRPQSWPGSAGDDEAELRLGDEIELGEIVAQRFALALDPHPRKPGAVFTPGHDDDSLPHRPFAALERLKRGD